MEGNEFNRLLHSLRTDGRAIEVLYNFYYGRIVQHLSYYYGKELSEDAAQNFFTHLFDIAENLGYINSPTAWVYKCCENIAKRKLTYESRYAPLYGEAANRAALSDEELYGDLYSEIIKLDEVSQKIVKMIYWDGYSQREIADILKLNAATIRKKHSRAIKKLKILLK
jgi:RNA polymerase sigma-70 factor (ECF subfamily)